MMEQFAARRARRRKHDDGERVEAQTQRRA
jgi:hypothetical protein